MVCLGNICRSPIAEGLLRHKAHQHGLSIEVDSAGTIGFHEGCHPHPMSVECLNEEGLDISALISRKITTRDLYDFDYILCMDASNVADVKELCEDSNTSNKVRLIRDFGPDGHHLGVPDPYGHDIEHYREVRAMLHRAIDGFIQFTQQNA